ncbi:NfeD family protein [Halovulum dunhuangense]|uniref:NfeD family protein n=1 Tax=Halovulum dunhuangense TaxID=1505036 RepID=A0A849KZR1_9RHOB|nr:NfeD family protein [Halovulum dunhuangense]NNU79504.1 NfeD family protein [Halovulum dunhuangense]
MFGWLEGLSPWWWVAFGITLGALEMATMSFFLIWPGLAAVLMAVLLAFLPGMPGTVQIAVYAALAVALTFAGRAYTRRFGDGGDTATVLNDRASQMVGRRGTLVSVEHGEAVVEIDGVRWRAILSGEATMGTDVRVTGAQGMTLNVERA